MRETIFMYILGSLIIVGMIIAFLHKMKWVTLNNINTSQFTKDEFTQLVSKSTQLILRNKWIVFTPILLLAINTICQLIYVISINEQKLPWVKAEFEAIFAQPLLSFKTIANLFLSSINTINNATYSTYNSSLVVIISSLLLLFTTKQAISKIKAETELSTHKLVDIIKFVSGSTCLLAILLALFFLFSNGYRTSNNSIIYFIAPGIILFLQITLISSFIQSFIINYIKIKTKRVTQQNENLKLALNGTPNIFYMNIILLLVSTSIPKLLLSIGQFTEFTGQHLNFLNYIIPVQTYIFLGLLLFTPLLPFILTENTNMLNGLKNNFIIIKNNPIKYGTLLLTSLSIIAIPSVIKLLISGSYGRFSIISFFSDFLFSSLNIITSMLLVVMFAFFYNRQTTSNTVKRLK